MPKIYLDYASTTPVDSGVLEAMEPYFSAQFGNPGSVHSFGQMACKVIDESRETIARSVGAKSEEIIFTGSATEANNLALKGVANVLNVVDVVNAEKNNYNKRSGSTNRTFKQPRIIISSIEHASVMETAQSLEKDGVEVVIIPVDKSGVIDLKKLEEALTENTVLVSVMYANNEVGTIQPIQKIAKLIIERKHSTYPLFHTDAVQAFQYLDCNVDDLGVDFMTLSAHKIYGPKGVGALYARRNALDVRNVGMQNNSNKRSDPTTSTLQPLITGGGQEFGMRSGTENVPGIVGFAKAAELVASHRAEEKVRIATLRDELWEGIKKIFPHAEVNGPPPAERLPNNLNIYFPDMEAQFLLTKLDMAGVAASAGSACKARAVTSSSVVRALGHSEERARQSVRFSLGMPTTQEDIGEVLKRLKEGL